MHQIATSYKCGKWLPIAIFAIVEHNGWPKVYVSVCVCVCVYPNFLVEYGILATSFTMLNDSRHDTNMDYIQSRIARI